MVLGYEFESADIIIFFTLILLEGVLSFDNAAILAAMVRKLPVEQRRKALLYGLAGAYVFRVLAILSVAYIIDYPILKLIGGLYLIYLSAKHLLPQPATHKAGFEERLMGWLGLSGFWGVVVTLELADLVFALDQVLVAVAMTDKIPLIIAASLFAILALRLSAHYVSRLMDWFPALEKLAYLAVGWVGLKLVVVEIIHYAGYTEFEVPKLISVGVTFMLLVFPVLGKWIHDRMRKTTPPAS
ncbi:MAG: hypothetical protein KY455_03340 [Euryarchaeota archaeon]|nr:hypothetical protein [Euryarchaeota archaeon]